MSPTVRYATMTGPAHAAAVCDMMRALYAADPPATATPAAFAATVATFLAHPDRGRVVLIEDGPALVGYALLVPFWSNEYGGTLLFVDELYVRPEARGRGIGRGLFREIDRDRPFGAVAVALEVSPANPRARRLYEAVGLRERANATLAAHLPLPPD